MKKLLLSLFTLWLFGISSIEAKHVNQSVAKQVAQNYLNQNVNVSGLTVSLSDAVRSSAGIENYYVFNIQGNTGFVIISAEDAGMPLIAYSTEAGYTQPTATSNPNLFYWMEKRNKEIEYMRINNVQADSQVKGVWAMYSSSSFKTTPPSTMAVGPLCSTTWNQNGGGGTPYNSMCPGGSVTGCVATAMAQIMKKWAYPTMGNNSSSYVHPTYGTLSANYAGATYNWASMPNGSSNSDVALISYHCGVSVNMDYSPSGSGAYVYGGSPSAQHAYVNYFKYDPGIQGATRAAGGDAAWIAKLKTEFDAGRPVQYCGYTPGYTSGHSWVADGYDNSNNMHMNWGWGGNSNGYYAVNNLVPSGQPQYDFGTGDGALVGIKPLVPNTKLSNASCGITLTSMDQVLNCDYISVAASNFGYRVINTASSYTATYTSPNGANAFHMSYVPGIQYAKTYSVDVRAMVGGVWGSYGTRCSVTTPASIPTTKLKPASCGILLTSLSQVLTCEYVAGATNYGYRVTNTASSYTATYTKPNNNQAFEMGFVAGIAYAKTYTVEVRALVGGVWGNYGVPCTITTPAAPTTKLQNAYCGITASSLSQTLWCDWVSGATNYGYRVTKAGFSQTYTKPNANQAFWLTQVPGILYANTYSVEVRAMVAGVWGSYGPACAVSTPTVVPKPKLKAPYCNITLTSMAQTLWSEYVDGATNYGYRVISTANSYTATYTKPNANQAFWMTLVSGVLPATTYSVEVRAFVEGTWTGYGNACTITTPLGGVAPPPAQDNDRFVSSMGEDIGYSLTLSPNPVFENELQFSVQGLEEAGELQIQIVSILGEIMHTTQAGYSPGDVVAVPIDPKFSSGIYFVRAVINGQKFNQKFVVKR